MLKAKQVNIQDKVLIDKENTEMSVKLLFQMDFIERVYVYHYVSLGDIFASLGGLKSSFATIFEYITPIFIISFMY